MSDFFYMHGYAPYIWGAYGVCSVLLLGLTLATLRTKAKLKKQMQELEKE